MMEGRTSTSGSVTSVKYYLEAQSRIIWYETETTSTFRVSTKGKSMSEVVDNTELNKHRLLWAVSSVPYSGIPFMIIGHEVRECQHGPDRRKKQKDKAKIQRESRQQNDPEYEMKGRRPTRDTKRKDCTAVIYIRKIVKFPNFKIDGHDSKWKRKIMSTKCRQEIAKSVAKFDVELQINFPSPSDHTNHPIGELAVASQPNDDRVIRKIHELVSEGVTDATEMKERIQTFVQKELLGDYPMSPSNRRFFPTNKDLSNHMYRATLKRRRRQEQLQST